LNPAASHQPPGAVYREKRGRKREKRKKGRRPKKKKKKGKREIKKQGKEEKERFWNVVANSSVILRCLRRFLSIEEKERKKKEGKGKDTRKGEKRAVDRRKSHCPPLSDCT